MKLYYSCFPLDINAIQVAYSKTCNNLQPKPVFGSVAFVYFPEPEFENNRHKDRPHLESFDALGTSLSLSNSHSK